MLTPAKKAVLIRTPNKLHPGELQRQIDTLVTRLERLEHLALTKTTTSAPRSARRLDHSTGPPQGRRAATSLRHESPRVMLRAAQSAAAGSLSRWSFAE